MRWSSCAAGTATARQGRQCCCEAGTADKLRCRDGSAAATVRRVCCADGTAVLLRRYGGMLRCRDVLLRRYGGYAARRDGGAAATVRRVCCAAGTAVLLRRYGGYAAPGVVDEGHGVVSLGLMHGSIGSQFG
ncbi:hypothetical protein ERY13_32510 [Paenibacillus mucilaginosus]|uniref:hypothetical protein n=1 Tax=Paenibacillus mucilaginosus TaxID=61624 RepID=UPI00240D047A|nr:hypothetical protein [Paenibacillus mucilaginosus]WFA21593.1 hypothetical protein ERY13_32510 [Paenibacillus mucilaginosus]